MVVGGGGERGEGGQGVEWDGMGEIVLSAERNWGDLLGDGVGVDDRGREVGEGGETSEAQRNGFLTSPGSRG